MIRSHLLALALLAPSAGADVVTLRAGADCTIYESATGDLANGQGTNLFVGRNSQGSIRRSFVRFDVAAAVPPGSTIQSVELVLGFNQTTSPAVDVGLHRVLTAWGEGDSLPAGSGGGGTAPGPGDATWLHAMFDTVLWTTPGGDFGAVASASALVPEVPGVSVPWTTTAALVADVQGWLDGPSTNFGWALVADETVGHSAKRFHSFQAGNASMRPALTIQFTPPAGPGTVQCLGDGSGAACPCANEAGAGAGCASSAGFGMRVAGSGSTSLAADDLILTAAGCPPGNSGAFLVGVPQAAAPAWDGLLCVDFSASTGLFSAQFQTAGTAQATGLAAQDLGGVLQPGTTSVVQYWSRDVAAASPCGSGAAFSSGYALVWTP